MYCSITYIWQVNEASETLYSGVKLKIRDICYRASEASEILLGVNN